MLALLIVGGLLVYCAVGGVTGAVCAYVTEDDSAAWCGAFWPLTLPGLACYWVGASLANATRRRLAARRVPRAEVFRG